MWKRAQGIQALPRWALIGNPITRPPTCFPATHRARQSGMFWGVSDRVRVVQVNLSRCYAGHLQVWPLSKAWTTICDGSAISAFCLLLYASGQGLSYPIWNLLIKNLTEQDLWHVAGLYFLPLLLHIWVPQLSYPIMSFRSADHPSQQNQTCDTLWHWCLH